MLSYKLTTIQSAKQWKLQIDIAIKNLDNDSSK